MKSISHFLSLFAIACLANSCDVTGQNHVRGSGNMTKEERNVGAFKRVSAKGSMDVYITQGPAKAAVIEAEDNIAPLIELENRGEELVVRLKRGTNVNTRREMKVYLTSPEIEGINLSGSGNVKLENKITNDNSMEVSLSGSGDMEGELNAPDIKASIAGSGNVKLAGETKNLDLSIAGSGDFRGADLMSENVDVNIAGSGNANVHASVKLDASIMGSGNVRYKGSPQVSSKVMGSGAVVKN